MTLLETDATVLRADRAAEIAAEKINEGPVSAWFTHLASAGGDYPSTSRGPHGAESQSGKFFAETEQVAFCAENVVPGIDFTNDPLLQGRLFSYQDTQLKRLGGPNFHQIPINQPKCPFHNLQRDGHMQMAVPPGHADGLKTSLAFLGR